MIYFIIYLFLEVVVSVNIASMLGGVLTFAELILSAFIGFIILANFKGTIAENIASLNAAKIDPAEFQRLNLYTIVGAILLIVPGFLTDIIGILLQFGIITKMLVNRFVSKSQNRTDSTRVHTKTKDENVIDVEIVSDDTTRS